MQKLKKLIFRIMPVKWRFTRIYRTGGWNCEESVSGGGSTLEATEPVRRELPSLIAGLGVRSILDAPCGDFTWMKEVLKDLPDDIRYTGADIVTPLIESLQRFSTDNARFIVADIIGGDLPQADLILCRDCFIHFSQRDIRSALANFSRTGARYLITNSFPDIDRYQEIDTGRWRQLNLELPPFSFPAPLAKIAESGNNGKFLGLWELDSLQAGQPGGGA